jgi:hypothetical protein
MKPQRRIKPIFRAELDMKRRGRRVGGKEGID